MGNIAGLHGVVVLAERMMAPGLEVAWVTHRGRVRRENQDAIGVVPLPESGGLFVVLSDGLGAQAGGAVASQIVRDRLLQSVPVLSTQRPLQERFEAIREALLDADRMVREAAAADLRLTGMGATVLVAAVTPTAALHVYAGDSRLYHFRAGKRIYRTRDHSIVEVLRQVGRLEESEMQSHPQRNALLSCVGGGDSRGQCDIAPLWKDGATRQEVELGLVPGDTLLLCTDGLHGLVGEEKLAHTLSLMESSSTAEQATRLVEAALEAGGTDNITLAVVRVDESSAES